MHRRPRFPSALLLAGLLGGCATTAPKPSPASEVVPEGPVTLRFAWPEGFSTKVDYTSSERPVDEPEKQEAMTYTLRVEEAGKERRVLSDRPLVGGTSEDGDRSLHFPPVVISRDGDFLRIEGGREAMAKALKGNLGEEGVGQEQQEAFIRMTTAAFERYLQEQWRSQVERWKGLTLKPGEPLARAGTMVLPLLGSSAVFNTEERILYKERVPCDASTTELRCVHLVMDVASTPESARQVEAAISESFKATLGTVCNNVEGAEAEHPFRVPELIFEAHTDFIVEPSTLVPHHEQTASHIRMRIESPATGQDPRTLDSRTEVELTYAYGAAAPKTP